MTTLAFAIGTVVVTASLGFHREHTRANDIRTEHTTKAAALERMPHSARGLAFLASQLRLTFASRLA